MRRLLTGALLSLTVLAFALDVAEEELQELGTREVEFTNYAGPYETIDTIEQIVGIGRALGAGIDVSPALNEFTHAARYRVIHAVDPQTRARFDADIIVPLPMARVDHITNLRRIISGFLQTAYSYSQDDADLLARWITIYNAIVRGNIEFFSERYKPVVTDHLTVADAGLSRRYDEWPGRSRIVIPLHAAAAPGLIGSVEPAEVADDRVVEELRMRDDRGVDDRQAMIGLTERVIDERELAIERAEAEIALAWERIRQEEERLAAERDALDRERLELETLRDDLQESAEAEIAEREADLDSRDRALEEERRAAEEQLQEILDERQEVAMLTERVRAERERIARDARALLDEQEITERTRGLAGGRSPVHFIRVRHESGGVLGQLVQIDPANGLLLNRSDEDRIVSRSYTYHAELLLVVVDAGGAGRLAHYEVGTLAETARGESEVFPASVLQVHGEPPYVYAIVRAEGAWHLGRFDAALELSGRSVIAVNPDTTLTFDDGKVWVQTADDRIVPLGLEDLRIAP